MDELEFLLAELSSGDDQRAESAAQALGRLGKEARWRLHPMLNDPNPDIRWWATRTLAEFPSEQSAPYLIRALQDVDPSVRQCAAQALYQNPHESAIPMLVKALSDEDSLVAHLAANALISIGPEAVAPLIDMLSKGASILQIEAARALAMIGDQRAIPILFEALDADSALVEHWAYEGLERMGVGMVFYKP